MKKLLLILPVFLVMSCGTIREVQEDQLFLSRRYVGNFIEYRQTGIAENNGPNLIWIKTSMEDRYGKISAYGKKCDFAPGERLYLRRKLYSPGMISSYWQYYVENDSTLSYQATEYQHDKKTPVETWF
jgi:hypothetical protein